MQRTRPLVVSRSSSHRLIVAVVQQVPLVVAVKVTFLDTMCTSLPLQHVEVFADKPVPLGSFRHFLGDRKGSELGKQHGGLDHDCRWSRT